MDYHSLPRRQLQTLCKKHGIPANSTNADMAEALAALLQPKSQSQPEKRTTRASDKSMIKEDSVSEPPQNEAVPKTRQTARRRGASSEEEGHKLASESNLENPTEGEGSRSISLRRGHVKVKSTEDVSDIPRAKSGAKTKETSIDSSDTVKLQKTCLVNTHTDRSKKKKGAVTFSDTVEVKTTEQQAEIDNSEAGLINVEPERVLRNSTRHQVVEPAPVMKKVTTRRTGTRKSISQSISSEDSKDKTEISRRTRGLSFKDSTSQSISTEDSEDKTEISRRTRGSSVKAVTVETNKGTSRSRSSKYEKENKEEHLVDSTQVEFPPPQAENVRRSRRFSILPTGNNHIQISADAEMKMSGDVNTERSSRRNRNMNLSSVAALKSKSEQVISENNKDALEAQEKPPNQRRNTFRKRHDEVIPSATVKERVPRPLRERVSSRRQENGALEKSADRDESSNKDTEMFHKSCNVEEICVSEEHMSVSCSKIVEATFVDIVDHQSENGVILPEVEEHSQNVSCQSAGKLIQEEEAEVEEHNKVAFRISSVQIQVEDASVGLEEREKTEKKESVETVTCIENPNCEAQKEQETEADIEEPNKADIEISIVKTEEEDTLASLEDDYQEQNLSCTEEDNSVQTMACIENPECEVQKEMEVEIRELFKEVNDLSGVLAETEDATFDSEDHSEEHSMCCSEDEAKEEKEESIVELLQTEVEDDCQEQNLSCTLKEPLKKVNDLSVVLKETEDATFDSEDHSEEHIISCLEDEEKEDKEESIVELFQTEMENASATPEIHYQELNLFCIKEEEKMEKKDTVQTMVCTENLESEVEKEQEAEAEFKDSDKELNDLSGVLTEAEDHSEEHSMSCLEDEEKVGSEESIDTVELLQPEAQSEQIDLCNVDVQDCELDETEEVIQAEADYEQIVPCKVEIQDCEVHEKHTVVHSCSISDFKSTGTNSDENTHDVLYGYEAEPGPVVKVHALPVNSEHEGELLHRLTCIQDETSEDDFTGLETLFYEDTPSEHEFTGIENLFVEEGSTEPESCEIRTLFAAHEVRGVEGDEVSCDVSNISHECVKNKIRFAETSIVCSNPVTHASLSISEDSYVDSTKHDVAEQGEENSAHIEAEFDNPNKFLTASNEEEKEFTLEEAFIKYNEIKQCTPEISENKSDFAQREAANVELLEFAASEDSTEYTGVEQDEKRSPHKADECCMHLNTQHLLCQPDLCDSLIDAFYRLKIDVPSKRFSFVEREKITETNDIESNCQCKIDNIAAKEDMMNHSTQMDTQLSMYTESNPVVNNVNDSEELSFTLNLQKMVEDLVIMKMQKEEPSKTADPLGCDKQLETSEVTLSNTNHFETELTVRNELTDKVEAVEELSLTLNLQKMVEDIILSSKTETKDVKPLKSAELPESEIKPDMNNITVIDEVEVAEELSLTSAFQKTVEELILFPSIAIQMDETTESHCHGQQDSNECHVAEGHSIVKEVLDEILSGIAKEQTVTSVPTPQRSMQQIDLTLKSIRNLREMCIKQSSENATSSKRLPPATPANVKRSALKAISSNIGNTPSASGVGMNTPITKSNIRHGMEQQRIVASPGHTPFVFKRDLSFHR